MNTHTKEVYSVSLNQIKSYLKINEWSPKNENERWLVFESDHPVDIVLAKNARASDYCVYVDHMLKTLASATNKTSDAIVNEILLFDRDVLTLAVDSNSIDTLARQMPGIKSLIGYAANSEHNLKPFFSQYYRTAKTMLEHFQISQELNGGISFRIESQVGEKEPYQQLLFRKESDPGDKLPLQRRVMERIAVGLIIAEKAAMAKDAQLLVEGYIDGFNANMCDAVRKMSTQLPLPIQFSLKWSKKIDASEELKAVRCIRIERQHREYLSVASDKLKELKPELKRIKGLVIGLSSLGDPQSDEVYDDERSIIVQWEYSRGRTRKIKINLGKHDYLNAIKAHKDWATISVDGIALQRRSGWQLADPQAFKILR